MLTAIDVGTQADPDFLLHLGYTYDEFGNVTTLTEGTTGNPLTYDGQSRVTGAFGPTYSYWPSGRFDRFVGLTFAYGTGNAAGSNRSPLHGVVSTAAGGAFAYDLNGNMVSRKTTSAAPTQTLAWSLANELLSVTTGATVESYRYDAEKDGSAARRARFACRDKRPAQTKVRCARTEYALYCSLLPTCSEFAQLWLERIFRCRLYVRVSTSCLLRCSVSPSW